MVEDNQPTSALIEKAQKVIDRHEQFIGSEDTIVKYTKRLPKKDLNGNVIFNADGGVEFEVVDEKSVTIEGNSKEDTFKELYGFTMAQLKASEGFKAKQDRVQYVAEKSMASKLRSYHNPFKAKKVEETTEVAQ